MKNNFLHKLGYTTQTGLVHNLNEAQNNVERLYIEEAQKLDVPANAVFFRRYYRKESDELPYFSVPSVCIFKQDDSFFNTQPHKELHAALWSAGKIEIYIIYGDTRIDIINGRKPAKRVGKDDVTLEHQDLILAQSALKEFEDTRFAAHLFGSGTFWEQSDFQEKIDSNSQPYAFLLDYLMQVRTQLIEIKTWKLKEATIDKLLITSILIKFLEDIKDDEGKHTLRKIYKKYRVATFEEGLLKEGICLKILRDLSKEFNGKVFNTFTKQELVEIALADLTPIAKFLSGNIDIRTNQGFLWKQYSFKHLPAEVISAIYENFIQAEAERKGEPKKGVVYTPLPLVNLLIDEVMPLDQPELFKNNRFKVLDPACGSGVFLVAAYKRMLQWWTINNNKWNKTDEIKYPTKIVAKKILEENIFGVDIEEVAALVSIFGLTIAFLDKLTPKEIWDNLKFKDLSERNIHGVNFVDWAKFAKEKEFDLVIGNPPFNPSKKGTITNEDLQELCGKKVPGNKLALKFFEAALLFGQKVCMIIPSNVFLYNKSDTSHEYRKEVFTKYTVEKIYDFTHLRRDLFHKTADTPVIALIVEKVLSKFQAIEHIVVKRQLLSEKKIRFEIDYYDKHQVRWNWAIDDKKQFVWKTNLLGGGRLFHLVYRLSLLGKLGEFLNQKVKERKWVYNNGYISQYGDISNNEQAKFLNKKLRIKPRTFDELGNYETEFIPKTEYFWNKRSKELFEPPHIIFQLVFRKSKIPMAFVSEYLCFNSSFVGISAPEKEKKELYKIYNRLFENDMTSNLYRAFILANSSKALVYHETSIVKEDIDNLPYPQNEGYLDPSKEEAIIIKDVLEFYRHLGKSISKTGEILHTPIIPNELDAFGKTYCDALNDIYAEDGNSWQSGQVLQTPTFISYQFGFGKNGGLKRRVEEGSELDIDILLNNLNSNQGIIHKRIIRKYQHIDGYDCVFLIKPKNRRYWLQSIALRDADDTFMDLKKAGF
ncbi:MAG: N-6 DNA methylase [Chitinophagales bacterium]